jgi:hypothetical protein
LRGRIGDAHAVVLDINEQGGAPALDTNDGRDGVGVAMHVGQRFLDDAEDGQFKFFFEPAKAISDAEGHGDAAAVGEKFCVGIQRGNQTRLLQ